MTTKPTDNPQLAPALALVELLKVLPEMPEARELYAHGVWEVARGGLKGSLFYGDEPFEVLRVLADRFGGSIRPHGQPYRSALGNGGMKQIHELSTTFMDVRVTLRVAVSVADEVAQLRARVAELEAAQSVSA